MHAISFSSRLFVSVEGNDLISLWTVFLPEDHRVDLGKKKKKKVHLKQLMFFIS